MAALWWPGVTWAQETAFCDDFLQPKRDWKNEQVGPESCFMQETGVTLEGRKLRRVDMGVTGTVEGYLPKSGSRINYLSSAPELIFPQAGNSGPIYPGIGRYDMDKGSSMTLLYPTRRSSWNQIQLGVKFVF